MHSSNVGDKLIDGKGNVDESFPRCKEQKHTERSNTSGASLVVTSDHAALSQLSSSSSDILSLPCTSSLSASASKGEILSHPFGYGSYVKGDDFPVDTSNYDWNGGCIPSLPTSDASVNVFRTTLLAQPSDVDYLSPIHCLIRRNIEVFVATEQNIAEPAPGRKKKIHVGHVGLRCIYCGVQPPNQRAKRAVVFPSSIGRIYSQVSDMKADHFELCRHTPNSLKEELKRLKGDKNRSPQVPPVALEQQKKGKDSKSTSRIKFCMSKYYKESAIRMGMMDDTSGGVIMQTFTAALSNVKSLSSSSDQSQAQPDRLNYCANIFPSASAIDKFDTTLSNFMIHNDIHSLSKVRRLPISSCKPLAHIGSVLDSSTVDLQPDCSPTKYSRAHVHEALTSVNAEKNQNPSFLLATPDDSKCLNDLHCFVRKNIEAFLASEDDMRQPQPGRRTPITLGQVGLRCIHCKALPSKERVKRAVCYPSTVEGIYHSVCNMKFDHFSICKAMPGESKKEYQRLTADSSRKNNAARGGLTSQYYLQTAREKGFVDSDNGIRLRRTTDVKKFEDKSDSQVVGIKRLLTLAVAASTHNPRAVQHAGMNKRKQNASNSVNCRINYRRPQVLVNHVNYDLWSTSSSTRTIPSSTQNLFLTTPGIELPKFKRVKQV